MTSQHRTRAGLAATLAVASLAASASGASADPNPEQRLQSRAAALTQEQYEMSHKPAIPGPGHNFATIEPRASADAPSGANDFEWGDAAIGAGGALGLALVLAGGAVVITRRNGRAATS